MYSTAGVSSDPVQQLFSAVITEDFKKIDILLKAGVSITSKAPGGDKHVLHFASEAGMSEEGVNRLIALGADVNAKTTRDFTPLHVAAQRGKAATMIALIKAGANIEALFDNGLGTTPLQEAAYHGQLEAVRILMAAGADAAYRERKHDLNAINLATMNAKVKVMPLNDIINAILGAGLAFKKQVRDEIEKWNNKEFAKDSAEALYIKKANDIPHKDISSDEYFLSLRTVLNEDYEPIKESVRPLRSAVISYMKNYNEQKKSERELKAIFTPAAGSGASASP
ncbi:MAG: ankyrin repeat domain-containing protein [Gammaproteobacteria bacterium]|nr:ankyrin repeat domain-containing protein [Gammaproteobacteria bacterium]